MFENITNIIGFDLGHGETALAQIYLSDSDKESEPELLEVDKGEKNVITALGYSPEGVPVIGESAIVSSKHSYMAFKRRPDGDPAYYKIMHDFISTIHRKQKDQGRINVDGNLFIVGCPSEWTSDSETVDSYARLFSGAGIRPVKVVSESRAAYMHAKEKAIITVEELSGSAIVIDLGSSTTDVTFIDQNKRDRPIDIGRDLGASFIDKAIFRWTLNNHPCKSELENTFSAYEFLKNRCELRCRQVKEEYYKRPEIYQDGYSAMARSESIQGISVPFSAELNGSIMSEILETPFVNLDGQFKTWPSVFQEELVKLRQELESSGSSSPSIILLTGGASRMDFVQQICQKVFPNSTLKRDNTPEFSIAMGLARWGRVEVNTTQFSRDVEEFCARNIHPRIESQIDTLYESIAGVLVDEVIKIVKEYFDRWKARDFYSSCLFPEQA